MNKVAESHVYLRKRDTGLQDDGPGSELIPVSNDLTQMLSNVQHLASGGTTNGPDALKASSKAISLAKYRISDLQLSSLMPSRIQHTLKVVLNELTKAEKYVQAIDGIVSQHYGLAETSTGSTHRRILSSKEDVSRKYHYNPGITKADHLMRTKSYHSGQ